MRVIFASKFYYRRGGLEAYLFKTKQLLESHSHTIVPFSTSYHENIESEYSPYFCEYMDLSSIKKSDIKNNLRALGNMFFNREAYVNVKRLCAEEKPDILQGFGVTKHLSASIFKAAKDSGVPTVMRLSDYALLCPNSTALDGAGQVCSEFDCYTKMNLKCIQRRCVKGSTLASIIGLIENKGNSLLDYYKKYIDHWIAPSRFIRDVFINHYKLPEEKITYVPVFLDAENIKVSDTDRNYLLYAGRIDKEKGVATLLKALEKDRSLRLLIAGSGPLEEEMKSYVSGKNLSVEFLGFKNFNELQKLIAGASLVVIPSEWYENSPNIVLEAYAYGKPVVGANIGGIPELVLNGETGYLFNPGSSEDLLVAIHRTLKSRQSMGQAGREFLEARLNPNTHYEQLVSVYNSIMI